MEKRSWLMTVFVCTSIMFPKIVFGDANSDLKTRIEVLEKTLNSVQKSLLKAVDQGKFANNIQPVKDSQKDISELYDSVKLLRTDIERLEIKLKKNTDKLEVIEKSTQDKIDTLSKNNTITEGENINYKDSYIIKNISKEMEVNDEHDSDKEVIIKQNYKKDEDQASVAYQKAYVLLKQKNADGKIKYDKAMVVFYDFVKQFPNSNLVGNAYYWIGSIYVQQKNYNKAAIEFLNGYKANTKSGRAIDNLLGLSDSLLKLGKTKDTCAALNKLFNEFTTLSTTNKRTADELYKNASCLSDD